MTVFKYIDAEKESYSVTKLCRNVDVSRGGFHKWSKPPPSQRRRGDERLGVEIRAIHRIRSVTPVPDGTAVVA